MRGYAHSRKGRDMDNELLEKIANILYITTDLSISKEDCLGIASSIIAILPPRLSQEETEAIIAEYHGWNFKISPGNIKDLAHALAGKIEKPEEKKSESGYLGLEEGDKVEFYVVDNIGKIRKKQGVIRASLRVVVEASVLSPVEEIYALEDIYNYLSDEAKESLRIKKIA